jgi:hypothetical protein
MPATHLHVIPWEDPVVKKRGFGSSEIYVVFFWVPVLGAPAAVLLWRLGILLDARPDGFSIRLDDLGHDLGLGTCDSKHAPLPRAISRLVQFGLAKRMAPGQLAIRQFVEPLSQPQVNGLTPYMQELHHSYLMLDERADDRDPPASEPSPRGDPTGD